MSILNKLDELNNQRLRMLSDIKKVGNTLPNNTKYPNILAWYKVYKDLEAPFNVIAVFEDEAVTLSWESNQNDVQYSIYKSSQPFTKEESITPITTISNKSFTDSDVVSDTTYYYRISAVKDGVQKLSTLSIVHTEDNSSL